MARILADDEIMQRGDWLILDGRRKEPVAGYAGEPALKWRSDYPESEAWVEEGPRNIADVCNVLCTGLEVIRGRLWEEY